MVKKISILFFFYLLPAQTLVAQYDSVFNLPYFKKYEAIDSIGNKIMGGPDTVKVRKEIDHFYKSALKTKNPETILTVEVLLLRFKLKYDKTGEALKYAGETIEKARLQRSVVDEVRCHAELHYYYYLSKQYNLAFEEGLKAYEIIKLIPYGKFDNKYYYVYSLAFMYYQFFDYENALRYSNEVFYAAATKSIVNPSSIKKNVHLYASDLSGMIYQKTGAYDSALYFFELIPRLASETFNNDKRMVNIWTGIAKGNMGVNWYLQKEFVKAIPLLQEGTQLTYANQTFDNSAIFAVTLARIFLSQKKPADAEKYLNIARQSVYAHYDDENYYNIYKTLSDFYRTKGNIQATLLYQDSSLVYKEKLANKLNVTLKTRTEFKFFQQRKEAEAQKLNEETKSQARISLYAFIGLLLMLILVIIILRSLLINRRKNKIITWQRQEAERSLREKEVLLKEIHHRVKNNLQVVGSLLEMHQIKNNEPQLQQSYDEARSQVRSIGLIHQNLYQHDNLSAIDLNTLVNDLYKQVNDVFNHSKKEVCLETEINNIQLDIDTALPLGLIVNELLTNSFKYAFGTNAKMEIYIAVTGDEAKDNYNMIYRDNGPGMPDDKLLNHSQSLGIRLIKDLTRQIGGKLNYTNDKGGCFHFRFMSLKGRKNID